MSPGREGAARGEATIRDVSTGARGLPRVVFDAMGEA